MVLAESQHTPLWVDEGAAVGAENRAWGLGVFVDVGHRSHVLAQLLTRCRMASSWRWVSLRSGHASLWQVESLTLGTPHGSPAEDTGVLVPGQKTRPHTALGNPTWRTPLPRPARPAISLPSRGVGRCGQNAPGPHTAHIRSGAAGPGGLGAWAPHGPTASM